MPELKHPKLSWVLKIHAEQISRFGGPPGVRDVGLLESALAQPNLEVFGKKVHDSPEAQAAAYVFHIIKNHPFVDGNKRTAWVVALTFLHVNGFALGMDQEARFELVMAVASGEMGKDELARVFKKFLQDVQE